MWFDRIRVLVRSVLLFEHLLHYRLCRTRPGGVKPTSPQMSFIRKTRCLIRLFVLSKFSSGLSCDIMWLSLPVDVCSWAAWVYQSMVWAQREAQSQTMVHPPLLQQMHSLHNSCRKKQKKTTFASMAVRRRVVFCFLFFLLRHNVNTLLLLCVRCCLFLLLFRNGVITVYDTLCSNLHDSLLPISKKFCCRPAGSRSNVRAFVVKKKKNKNNK